MCGRSKVAPEEYEEKSEEKPVELEPVEENDQSDSHSVDSQSESSSADSQSEVRSVEESELEVVTEKSIENGENNDESSDSEDDSDSETESESVVSEPKPTNQQQENPTVLAASSSGLGILLLFSFISGVIEIKVYRIGSKSDRGFFPTLFSYQRKLNIQK